MNKSHKIANIFKDKNEFWILVLNSVYTYVNFKYIFQVYNLHRLVVGFETQS